MVFGVISPPEQRLPLPSYVVISPVKDEAEHLLRTAASLQAQDHPPRPVGHRR